jgi:hypothetical protein
MVCRVSTAKASASVQLDSLSYVGGLRSSLPELSDPQQSEPIPKNFTPYFLLCVKELLLGLIEYTPSTLKCIRARQEDRLGAHSHSRMLASSTTAPRADVPAFLGILALLFEALPPEEAPYSGFHHHLIPTLTPSLVIR